MLSAASGSDQAPVIWVLYDHKIGSKNQCQALADALARRWGAAIETKELRLREPWRRLPAQLHPLRLDLVDPQTSSDLTAPWPQLVIASGSKLVAPALAIKAASRGQCMAIQILDPGCYRACFDAIITPAHDRLTGANVISIKGALALEDAAALEAGRALMLPQMGGVGPHVAVMIGGSNKDFELRAEAIIEPVERLLDTGAARVYLCGSRRTPEPVLEALRQRFANDPLVWQRDEAGPNPYWGLLALSDVVCVTQDSISMASEAARLGRPVLSLPLARKRRWALSRRSKFDDFFAGLEAAGHLRPFKGALEQWEAPKLDDMATAMAALEPLLERHLGCDNPRP
jgi:mitochondrial fission protein ELM1